MVESSNPARKNRGVISLKALSVGGTIAPKEMA